MLGIGRARVHQYEQSAMRKIRKWLKPYLHQGENDDGSVLPEPFRIVRERAQTAHSAAHGWLRVTKLVGNGVFPTEAICFAFNELRMTHEKDYRPPILVGKRVGYASAGGVDASSLLIRVWLPGATRTLNRIGDYEFELEVEIVRNIPVVCAGVVTVSDAAAEALRE